jgi:hypothetical protein
MYLQVGAIPDDETETRCLAHRAKGYVIHKDKLYRLNPDAWHTEPKGMSSITKSCILQRCIPIEQGKTLLLDIHEGICGHHASLRSMVGKAFRHGFYWPTTTIDMVQIVKSYKGCQYFVRQVHTPAQKLQTIPIT